jgi:hypothetical protein
MNLFAKILCFIITEIEINFILGKQIISSALRNKSFVCFAYIYSHLTVVAEEQCDDLIFI